MEAGCSRLTNRAPFFGRLGEVSYDSDEDKVQCHLCGRWLRAIGGSHLSRVHGWTLAEYRDVFHLRPKTPTVAAGTSALFRANATRRIAAGELLPPPLAGATPGAQRLPPWRSLAGQRPDLADELHPTRNRDVDASAVPLSSGRQVWWRCSRCSHEWRTAVRHRAYGRGCPRCATARRAALQGRVPAARSLAVLRPELARELHPTRNGELDARTLGSGSGKRVWWQCQACGHEWRTSPKHRTAPSGATGCPACAQERRATARRRVSPERSLAALGPDLAQVLHPSRNGDLDAYTLGLSSRRGLWWRCPHCDHGWESTARNRIRAGRCPRCGR